MNKKGWFDLTNKNNLQKARAHKFNLVNVSEPNLYRDLFTYQNVPQIAFNDIKFEMNMPDNLWITDTTFRDGQQSSLPFSVSEILDLYDLLNKLDNNSGIIRQTEFFPYSKFDIEAIYKCKERGYKFPEITTWIRSCEHDFHLIKDLEIEETGVLLSCSDYHIFNKLHLTRQEAFDKYISTVKILLENGIKPRCHLEDITRADFYGFVLPLVTELMNLSQEAKIPIKIRACDTLGLGVPYTGSTLPRSVPGIISGLRYYAGVPSELIEWHGHNDFYKSVVNSTTSWLYGGSSVNCTILGIGERTGNTPLEAMIIEYASLKNGFGGMNSAVITELADYFKYKLKRVIPANMPFIGSDFNKTSAGIHVDGLSKDEEIYNIFDTQKILNRPVAIQINQSSGLSGITYWINKNLNKEYKKNHPIIIKIKEWIDNQYNNGRQTNICDGEMLDLYNQIINLT